MDSVERRGAEVAGPVPVPTAVGEPAEVAYETAGAEDPWLPVIRLAAVVGLIDGTIWMLRGVAYVGTRYHYRSNMLVDLFYMGNQQAVDTVSNVGVGFFGLLLMVGAAQCLFLRTRGRRVIVVSALAVAVFAAVSEFRDLVRGWNYLPTAVRYSGLLGVVGGVLSYWLRPVEHVVVLGGVAWVMSREAVRARFEGLGK